MITNELQNVLYGYLGGIVRNQGGIPLEIGGIEDHVHLLVGLTASHRLDHCMRELKAGSSGWVRRERDPKFSWQNGYGAFTVSSSNLDKVKNYVHNQTAHHKGKDFKSEYVNLLELSGVEYDAKYLL